MLLEETVVEKHKSLGHEINDHSELIYSVIIVGYHLVNLLVEYLEAAGKEFAIHLKSILSFAVESKEVLT